MLSHGSLATITAVTLLAAGCHHSTEPSASEPGEAQPLPPASGTPIGFLVDDAAELKLTPDQVTRLEQIDDDLASRLDAIDGQMRVAQRPVEPDDASPGGGMQGRGGMRGGGMPGGMGGGGMRGGGGMPGGGRPGGRGMGGRGGGPGHMNNGGGPPGGVAAARLARQREDEVRDAFARAFMILDASQQDAARRLLESHDIDIERIGIPSPVEREADTPSQ